MRPWLTNSVETESQKAAEDERLGRATIVSDGAHFLDVLY
jgi:hypothetical protein